jgi:hypothetical protein
MGKNGPKPKVPMNKTIIKNGRIVRIRKDGTIKADLGPYTQNTQKSK